MDDNRPQGIAQLRKRSLYLLDELVKWDVYPPRRDRRQLVNVIRKSFNEMRLRKIHDDLEEKLSRAVMRKLSENL